MIEKSFLKKDEAAKMAAALNDKFNALDTAASAFYAAILEDDLEKPDGVFKEVLKSANIDVIKRIYRENSEPLNAKGTPKALKDERMAAVVMAAENIYLPLLAELNTALSGVPAELLKEPKISKGVKFDRSNIEPYATAKNTLVMDERQQQAFLWLQKFGELVAQANTIFYPVFDLCRTGSFLESDLESLSQFFNRSTSPDALPMGGLVNVKVLDMTAPDWEKVHKFFDPAFYQRNTIAQLERRKEDALGDYERTKLSFEDRLAELEAVKEQYKGESAYMTGLEAEIRATKQALKDLEETKPKLYHYDQQIEAVKQGKRIIVC